MYSAMSINEYITHRYYQHAGFNNNWLMQTIFKGLKINGGGIEFSHLLTHLFTHSITHLLIGHIEHHAETLDDMSLRTDARWLLSPASKVLSSDPYRGTAFSWSVTGLMFLQMIATTLPILFYLLKFSLSHTLLIIAPSLLLHVSIWNCLHPNMHYLPGSHSLLLMYSITRLLTHYADVPAKFGPASKWMVLNMLACCYIYCHTNTLTRFISHF